MLVYSVLETMISQLHPCQIANTVLDEALPQVPSGEDMNRWPTLLLSPWMLYGLDVVCTLKYKEKLLVIDNQSTTYKNSLAEKYFM